MDEYGHSLKLKITWIAGIKHDFDDAKADPGYDGR